MDAADDVPAFRPLSFLSSIADRVGELATGDGAGAADLAPADLGIPAPVPNTAAMTTADGASTNGIMPSAASTEEVWARVQLARNLGRPRTLEFVAAMADDFIELHGDRLFGDDEAMVAGLARIAGRRVVVIGQQKGDDTDENIRRNFGMPHPEGYRKAMRVMELAERVGLPVITFVDVPGAHPGPESEERGIAEAIARSIGADDPVAHARSWRSSPARAGRAERWPSPWATWSSPSRTPSTRSSAPKAVRRSCGVRRTRRPRPRRRCGCRRPISTRSASSMSSSRSPAKARTKSPRRPPNGCAAIIVDRLDALAELPTEALLESRYRRYRALGAYTEAAQPEVPERVDRRLADRLRDLLDPARRGMAPVTDSWSRDDPPAREEV